MPGAINRGFRGSSISTRLLLAFGTTTLLTVAVAAVGSVSYRSIGDSLAAITTRELPALEAAHRMELAAADLRTLAPALEAAGSEAERQRVATSIAERVTAVDRAIADFADADGADRMRASLESLRSSLEALGQGVGAVIADNRRRAETVTLIRQLRESLQTAIGPEVDRAGRQLDAGAKQASSDASAAVQRLVDGEVGTVRAALEIKAGVNEAVAVLHEVAGTPEPDRLVPLAETFRAASGHVRRALDGLPEGDLSAEVKVLASFLLDYGEGEHSLLALRRAELTTGALTIADRNALEARRLGTLSDMTTLQKTLRDTASQFADDAVFNLTIGAQDTADRGAEAIAQLIRKEVGNLRAMLEAKAGGNLLAGILATTANETMIERVEALSRQFSNGATELMGWLDRLANDDVGEPARRLISIGTGADGLFVRRADEIRRLAANEALIARVHVDSMALGEAVTEAVARTRRTIRDAAADAAALIEVSRTIGLAAAAASVALAVTVVWLVVMRGIARRLSRLTAAMSAIGAGRLDVAVPADGRDEIATMATALEVFRANALALEDERRAAEEQRRHAAEERRRVLLDFADRFEARVAQTIGGVAESASRLEREATDLAARTDQTCRESLAVSVASGQAARNVEQVASASGALSVATAEIARQVAGSARTADLGMTTANATEETVRSLEAAAHRIGDVVKQISDIASQTNMLALNATIEAARAGESGKGFAVVAHEVKTLAAQTARATADIISQIAAIQAVSRSAVLAIGDISQTIRAIGDGTTMIAAAVTKQEEATIEIAQSLREAGSCSNEVTTNIAAVTEAARLGGETAAAVLANARKVDGDTRQLSEEVRRFLAEVRTG